MGSGAGSHHFAAILQVGNYYKTSYQHTHCDYAIHVVQSKHQHVFVQYHWLQEGWTKIMQLEYGK